MHNFFELLDLEENFSIDKNLLEEKYFSTLGKYHPDRAPKDKISSYKSISSLINSAYETLSDDFQRASHMLEIHGINIKSDSAAPKVPPEILEEILEMQESLEDESKKAFVIQKALREKAEIISELKDLFDQKDYQNAATKTMYLKYLRNIIANTL